MDVNHIHERIKRRERSLLLLQLTLPIERLQSVPLLLAEENGWIKAHFSVKCVWGGGLKKKQRKNFERMLTGNMQDWKAPPSFLTVDLRRTQAPSGKGGFHPQQPTNQAATPRHENNCQICVFTRDIYQQTPQLI